MGRQTKAGGVFFEGSSWYHRTKTIQPDGTIKYSKRGGFESEADALESMKKHEEIFLRDQMAIRMKAELSDKGNVTFSDYMIWWFENVYSLRAETTTQMLGAYVLYKMIIPSIEEDVKLHYVSSEYLDDILERMSHITATAGNKGRELLNIALKDAVKQGFLKRNPVDGTKPYPREEPRVRIFSKNKLRQFLKVAAESDWYLEILLATFCGLRKGEILGLKFDDIDFERGTLHIRRQITADYTLDDGKIVSHALKEKSPKTENSERILKIPDTIMEELIRRKEEMKEKRRVRGQEYQEHNYISCQDNGLPHSLSAMNVALTKLCRRNGLEPITVHGLRHQYATILAEQGVPLVKISALLGHASIVTTYEYYVGQMDEEERIITFMNDQFSVGGEEKQDD